MKAQYLVKHNIDALLKARGQDRKDLAMWCRRPPSWLTQIMNEDGQRVAPDGKREAPREFQMKYLDRIAEFFGIATYQLFQPGISALTERRSGRERRTGLARRVSHRQAQLRPAYTPDMETVTTYERALLARIRRMRDPADRRQMEYLIDRALLAQDAAPNTEVQPDQPAAGAPTGGTVPHTPKRRKTK